MAEGHPSYMGFKRLNYSGREAKLPFHYNLNTMDDLEEAFGLF